MKSPCKDNNGFSIVEIGMIIVILSILFSMAVTSIKSSHQQEKEETLKSNLEDLRQATQLFYLDHHHYPCTKNDFNNKADSEMLKKQLMWYTNEHGKPSITRDRDFRFGPYLKSFPAEPMTNQERVHIDTTGTRILLVLKKYVADSTEFSGGWYYQAETGSWVVNLNRKKHKNHYVYY